MNEGVICKWCGDNWIIARDGQNLSPGAGCSVYPRVTLDHTPGVTIGHTPRVTLGVVYTLGFTEQPTPEL